jgi:hypothetical protein
MASRDLSFAIECSSQGAPAALVEDLAGTVFRHCGCSTEQASGLRGALQQASESSGAQGPRRCDVQFLARGGKLDVLVSSNGGRIWQASILLS